MYADFAAGLVRAPMRVAALALAPVSLRAMSAAAEARIERRRASVPPITYPPQLPVSERQDEIAAAIRDHQVVIVAGETGSRQDDAAAEDLPRARPRHRGHDRPHAAAPARRAHRRGADRAGARRAARRGRRLRGPLQRPQPRRHADPADDRRPAARRDARRPAAAPLRHDHRRRGARAQPQHRLPARLPRAAPAAPARPEADHHVGDDRPAALQPRTSATRRSSRSPAARTRSRSATGPIARPRTPTATRPTRSATPSRSCCASRRATCSSSSPASARSATRPRRCRAGCAPDVEILPLYARLSHARAAARLPAAAARRRIVLATNVAETSLTVPGIRYVVDPGTARISRYSARLEGAAAADRADLARRRPTSARAAAAASPTASASGSTTRRTSRSARASPTRRSCARTSPS